MKVAMKDVLKGKMYCGRELWRKMGGCSPCVTVATAAMYREGSYGQLVNTRMV